MGTKNISIRIEEEMRDKVAFIAEYEGRSMNSHILVLIRKDIKMFEELYGKIEEELSPDKRVKPMGKKVQ